MNELSFMNDLVVLVDEQDEQIDVMPKMEAHKKGVLHRAFSIFIFNSKGELLLQQRAKNKYHSAGLWSNTCCSHPRPGEDLHDAAVRRLKEEMGLSCPLKRMFAFIYKADLDNGLMEHEYDHVFTGTVDDLPIPNYMEVSNWEYVAAEVLRENMKAAPELYTEWLKLCMHNHWNKICSPAPSCRMI